MVIDSIEILFLSLFEYSTFPTPSLNVYTYRDVSIRFVLDERHQPHDSKAGARGNLSVVGRENETNEGIEK